MPTHPTKILTLNSGSSSLKVSLYQMADEEQRLVLSVKLERVGLADGHIEISGEGMAPVNEKKALPDHASALRFVFETLQKRGLADNLSAIGHRVVMGGPRHTSPQRVTPELVEELNALCRIDPLHMPVALKTIEAAREFRPGILQVACFDTSFHRTMPKVAQMYALPRALVEQLGIIRFGFHGLSYEYIMAELRRLDPVAACGKIIIAHLGNGASMVAVRDGESIETTMGFTPAGGLVMGSRSGDLDPGVVSYLMTQKSMSSTELSNLIYKESGMRGVSNLSSDMQDLTREKDRNPQAEEAIALFCYQAKKSLGGLVSVLDGVETVIFTGGIGENSALVRERICRDLSYLGLHVDSSRNNDHAETISTVESRVTVRVMKTNEELMIARHTNELLGAGGSI